MSLRGLHCDMVDELTDPAKRLLSLLTTETTTYDEIADALGVSVSTVQDHAAQLRDNGYDIVTVTGEGYKLVQAHPDKPKKDDEPELPDLSDVEQGDDPDESDLTNRERYIAGELQTGATIDELAEDLEERESVVTQHVRDLKRQGWKVYIDETAEHVAIEGDHTLRSSEHKGTRTRKANRWWERSHNALVREFRGLETPTATLTDSTGEEDWILHMTDLHAGDRVRDDDGNVIYSTEDVPDVINYITEKGLSLADKHGSTYEQGVVCWDGDFLTNEGIYEGQFEDLDAWLDEQHNVLMKPLLKQLKAFSERFPKVRVVCQVGNHGDHRASGTSKQANADLILYKSIRNTVSQLQTHADILENVSFEIGEARPYKNVELRGGDIRCHLRHGQHRKPQATTSARKKEWLSTLRDHDFDICFVGHHHVSGRVPWDGPPILFTASPKPAGEFVETLGERVAGGYQGVATCAGVSDQGVTGVFPVDTRDYGDKTE